MDTTFVEAFNTQVPISDLYRHFKLIPTANGWFVVAKGLDGKKVFAPNDNQDSINQAITSIVRAIETDYHFGEWIPKWVVHAFNIPHSPIPLAQLLSHVEALRNQHYKLQVTLSYKRPATPYKLKQSIAHAAGTIALYEYRDTETQYFHLTLPPYLKIVATTATQTPLPMRGVYKFEEVVTEITQI